MHRAKIRNLLDRYTCRSPEDALFLLRTQQFVEENPECFERSLKSGHITGSSWIIDTDRTSALFTHHKKLNAWFQLGGHADGDADIFTVARKESLEESGLPTIRALSEQIFDIDIHLIPDSGSGHFHYDIRFLFEADRNLPLIVTRESHDLAWIPFEKIPTISSSPSILRMIKKTKEFL